MGNTLSNEAAYAMNLATQKHLLDLNSAGFQDFTGQNKIVSQLSETYFFSSQDSHLKMIQKVFMKKLDEAKLKIVHQNLEYINSSIVLSSYPYFLLSLPEKKNLDLSILYRQHLRFTLEEKIAVGTYLGQQEKIYIAYQILMCSILLHELK
jgi:hypothetical protein